MIVRTLAAFEVGPIDGVRTFQLDSTGAAFAVKRLNKERPPMDEDPEKEVGAQFKEMLYLVFAR
jgi:hypothetical protein